MKALRFGTFLAPKLLATYQAIAETVGQRLGAATEFVVETSYESCLNDVNDVCFVCSLPYVTFEQQGVAPAIPIAAPVLIGERYGGRPIYFSDVIVHRSDPTRSFDGLRGRSWAYNEPLSQSGYGITRYHLLQLGETDGFFGEVVESGFHEISIAMVRDGLVDASAIDSQVLSIALRDDPELDDSIRVIAALGPSSIQPIAVSKRLESDLRAEIRQAVLEMHSRPDTKAALAGGLIDRFVEVDSTSYDDIRNMFNACQKANFMEIR